MTSISAPTTPSRHPRMKVDYLLNPVSTSTRRNREISAHSHPSVPSLERQDAPVLPQKSISAFKFARDGANFSLKNGARGDVNFPPFENVGDDVVKQLQEFSVFPFGEIQSYCRHIPYNSGKKDFQMKTGRESFEVFQYSFTYPRGQDTYTVLWDYNIGLVRVTPFFRCCKYPKTTPAKMLKLNPGLKDISHSITGGAIVAQGYWLPFDCAKAVCATFCHKIAAALVPIFGPDFPASCVPPGSDRYGYMKISPDIVQKAKRDCEAFCTRYAGPINSRACRTGFVSINDGAGGDGVQIPRYVSCIGDLSQYEPGIEKASSSLPATPARIASPRRVPVQTYFPSPETPPNRSPELSNHSRPSSIVQKNAYRRPYGPKDLAMTTSRPLLKLLQSAPSCYQRAHRHESHPAWQHNTSFPSRKRKSSDISEDDTASSGDYVRPRICHQACLSPPDSAYPSSNCSETSQPPADPRDAPEWESPMLAPGPSPSPPPAALPKEMPLLTHSIGTTKTGGEEEPGATQGTQEAAALLLLDLRTAAKTAPDASAGSSPKMVRVSSC